MDIEEVVVRKLSDFTTSHKSLILLDSGDPSNYGKEYDKFVEFVKSCTEPFHFELSHLIYPLFVHFYLGLVYEEDKDEAKKFFDKYTKLFEGDEDYASKITELGKIVAVDDLERNEYFRCFRERKFIIKLSSECLKFFSQYLADVKDTIFFHFLNLYFVVETEGEVREFLNQAPVKDDSSTSRSSKVDEQEQNLDDDDDDDDIRRFIEDLKVLDSEPPLFPSICVCHLSTPTEASPITTAQFSNNCSVVAGGFEDSHISIWNLSSNGLSSCENKTFNSTVPNKKFSLQGHCGPVLGLSFTPDAKFLFSCSDDTTVIAWNLSNFNKIAEYNEHQQAVWDIDVSPLSCYFATASKDHTARLWSPENKAALGILCAHTKEVDCVKFHPNSSYLATGSSDMTVRLWDVQERSSVRLFVGHRGAVRCISFSPDGNYLATGGDDQTVKVWDSREGTLLKSFTGHEGSVNHVSFSPDGNLVASAATDNAIKVWDVLTLMPISDEGTPAIMDSNLKKISFSWKNIVMAITASSSATES